MTLSVYYQLYIFMRLGKIHYFNHDVEMISSLHRDFNVQLCFILKET